MTKKQIVKRYDDEHLDNLYAAWILKREEEQQLLQLLTALTTGGGGGPQTWGQMMGAMGFR